MIDQSRVGKSVIEEAGAKTIINILCAVAQADVSLDLFRNFNHDNNLNLPRSGLAQNITLRYPYG